MAYRSLIISFFFTPIGTVVLVSLAGLLSQGARASDQAQAAHSYRFWAGDLPPYCYLDHEQKPQGDLYQIFQTLAQRLGYKDKVAIMPWKRLLMESQRELPLIFMPAARSPDREKLYHWIEPLMTESFVVFSLALREREVPDKEPLKSRRLCTLRGSANVELARRHQFSSVETVATNETCARLLKAGRVDIWLSARRAAFASFAQAGYDVKELKTTVELEQWPLYLAASKSLPVAEVQRWRLELQKMKEDGSFERLLQKP